MVGLSVLAAVAAAKLETGRGVAAGLERDPGGVLDRMVRPGRHAVPAINEVGEPWVAILEPDQPGLFAVVQLAVKVMVVGGVDRDRKIGPVRTGATDHLRSNTGGNERKGKRGRAKGKQTSTEEMFTQMMVIN